MDTLTVMPVARLDPISAVTAPDPYEFYSELVAERPLYFDDRLHLWVASSAETVAAVLANPRCRVRPVCEPVPKPLVGSVAAKVRTAGREGTGSFIGKTRGRWGITLETRLALRAPTGGRYDA